jgi:hypothetical protein
MRRPRALVAVTMTAALRSGERGDLAVMLHALQRVVEVVDLVQRGDLGLVGESTSTSTRPAPGTRAVPVDAERVGQRERDGCRLSWP